MFEKGFIFFIIITSGISNDIIHIYMSAFILTYMNNTCTHLYIHIHSCMSEYTCLNVYIHIAYKRACVHTFIHNYICMCVILYLCIFIDTYPMCVFLHTCICHTGMVYDNVSVVFMHWAFFISNKFGLVSSTNIY